MHSKTFLIGLLAAAPLASALDLGFGDFGLSKRDYVGSIAARAIASLTKRQEADEFGPWDAEEDEFGSWVDKREAHHTEAQIAAKAAAAAAASNAGSSAGSTTTTTTACKRDADEFGPWDAEEDEFGSWVDKREAHHTEAQIAAKAAAAAAGSASNSTTHCKREAHHTEAQIAAKAAAAAGSTTNCKRDPHHTEAQIAAKAAAAAAAGSSSQC